MKRLSFSKTYQKLCSKLGMPGIILWHRFLYRCLRGHWPNFRHPEDLSERILASMHKKSFRKFADLADKVKVRDYIRSKGLDDILLEVYGVWDDARKIDFSQLPNQFALKPNNGSGGHFFCKDKSKIDVAALIPQMNQAMVLDRIGYVFEPHYKYIEPRIYCEELIDTGSEKWPTDYKFTCINGQIADIFVAVERETGSTKYCTMSTDWTPLDYTKKSYLPDKLPARPVHLDRMIEIAKILSSDFEFVRVDLYEYKNKVFFSELTFSPWGGMMYSYTDEAIRILGRKFHDKDGK